MKRDRHDYTDLEEKQRTRQETLDAVKVCHELWNGEDLLCDWLELTARHCPTTKMLIANGVDADRMIGVNAADPTDKKRTQAAKEQIALDILQGNEDEFPTATWHYGLFEEVCKNDIFRKAGVIVFDTHYSIGDHNIILKVLPIVSFFKRQVQRLGQAVLVINLVYRGSNGRKRDEAIQEWKKGLAVHLNITPEMVPTYIHTTRTMSMVLTRLSMDAAHL